jgi:DNA-binding transcriptional MerR regulator
MCSKGSQRLSAILGNTGPMRFRGLNSVENRGRQPIEEVYTIKQVVEMSGVPDNTIRSWERRYGIPQPLRSGTNQRRYTAANLEVIRAIHASRARGRTIEQAIHDVESDPVPFERQSITPGNERNEPEPPGSKGAHSTRILDALAGLDAAATQSLLADALWATDPGRACYDVLLVTEELLIRQRAEGNLTNVQATYGLDWIARKLHSALDASQPEQGRLTVVVAGMHDTLARSRCLALSIILSRAGYRVICLESDVTPHDVHELVERSRPAAIVLVVGSNLAGVSVVAAQERLKTIRESGTWRGVTLTATTDARLVGALPMLSTDPSTALEQFEHELAAQDAGLRLMRSE